MSRLPGCVARRRSGRSSDAGERPDLLDRCRDGTIDAVACPSCACESIVDAPQPDGGSVGAHRPVLDLNLPARIPESYVPEAALRLQLYRRLAGLTALDAVVLVGARVRRPLRPHVRRSPQPALRRADQSVGDQCRCGNDRVRGRGVADQMCAPGDAGLKRAARAAEEPGYIGVVTWRAVRLEIRGGRERRGDLAKTLRALRE